jgi:hypothetical protein
MESASLTLRDQAPTSNGSNHGAPVQLPSRGSLASFFADLPMIGQECICDLSRMAEGEAFELVPQFRPNNFDSNW